MFRKPDADLYARIFDDGEAGDTRMEWLRDGLKELREVPPHGLSNERLRDRLLGTGLAPVKPAATPWWTWAWAPVAAAAVAVVILPRLGPSPTPKIISGSGILTSNATTLNRAPSRFTVPPTALAEVDQEFSEAEAALIAAMLVSDGEPKAALVPVRRSGSSVLHAPRSSSSRRRTSSPAPKPVSSSRDAFDLKGLVALSDGARKVAVAEEATFAGDAALNASQPTVSRREATSDPLVLLAPEIDTDTGAAFATEVDSPANLSVGG